jgi:hypothetical protein
MGTRGDAPLAIQWRGGHTDFKTTQGYIEQGQKLAAGFGTPFPALPPPLYDAAYDVEPSFAGNTAKVATPTGIELQKMAENALFLPANGSERSAKSEPTGIDNHAEPDAERNSGVNPRAAALAALYRHAAELALDNDVSGARVLHDAIGLLLGAAGEGAEVVDLASERAKR